MVSAEVRVGSEPGQQGAESDAPWPEHLGGGAQAGRYVILARLGEGAMGEVFAGYDRELDRRVALKLLRGHGRGDAIGRARMLREAQALARLSHPNVVQVHDVGEVGGRLFVAMEYVKGETLGAWQRRHDPRTPDGRRAILAAYVQAGQGLAAAHAAGIVHRDFKPSNALVGDDGRTRVLDFGLATPQSGEGARVDVAITAVEGPRADFHADLTRTGSILGTPGYMAPEQFMAGETDARTDVFAFSVALYEALHGEAPFAGESFADRRQAVLVGDLRPAPPDAGVPAWLRAVIVRGLEFDPRARHRSIDAMLAALASDPVARRRRRLRLVTLAVAALALAGGLIVAGQAGWRRWHAAVAETRAGERLAALEDRITAGLAAGALAEAEGAFAGFVAHPDNRGTAAVGRAWLHRADRARARGDAAATLDALAGAHMTATTREDQAAARIALARAFRDEMAWPGLQLAIGALDEEAVDASELQALRFAAALARRDLGEAASLLRGPLSAAPEAAALPVLVALQAATPTEHHHRGAAVIADIDGDGREDIVLETDARARKIAPLLRAEPTLPQIATLDLEVGRFRALAPGPDEPALLLGSARTLVDGRIHGEAVMRRWTDGRLAEVLRWPEHAILATLAVDLDGDGTRELFVGSGPYTRRISELSRGPDGAWTVRSAAPEVDRRRSDVVDLLADDLDGDGSIEVVAALGPWRAYELELLRRDPASGDLRRFARRRLGNIAGAALVRRGPGPPEIAVSKTDEYRSEQVFPAEHPYGDPAGVYLLRLVDGALVQTGFAAAPRLIAGAVVYGRPLVGDLDGDGRDELIVGASVDDGTGADRRDITTIFVGAADGLHPLVLGDLRPIAALDLDGDADAELIVSDSGIPPNDRVWVLGSGAAALPSLVPRPPAPDGDPPADPVLARMWRSADELARMGLVRQAADNLATAVDLAGDPDLRARASLRAGELRSMLKDDARAAALYARAASEPAFAGPAHAAAARAYLRRGRLAEAADHLAGADEPPADVAAALAALRGEPGEDLDFTRPLAGVWRLSQPLAVRRDGARGSLHVDAVVPGELMAAPVRWSGGGLILEVDLDLARVEWNAGLEIGLVRAGADLDEGSGPLGVHVTTTGGGSERTREIACMSYGRRSVARVAHRVGEREVSPVRVTVRAVLLPELGEWTCAVEGAGGSPHYGRLQLAPEAREVGPLHLTVATSRGSEAWVEADIERLVLVGAALVPGDAAGDPWARPMVEDDPLAALAALAAVAAPTPDQRLLTAAVLTRLGRLDEAVQALAPVFADPAVAYPLRALLRRDPVMFGALVRAIAGPVELHLRIARAWGPAVLEGRDPRAMAVVWSSMADIDRANEPEEALFLHGMAAAALGHREAARASQRAALVALADPARREDLEVAWIDEEATTLRLELAALALADGDEEAARRELRAYVTGPGADPYFIDRLRARDDLHALHDLVDPRL